MIAYIDGFNLYFGLKSKGWKRYYWLDPRSLVSNLLKPTQVLVEVKYFTARISSCPVHSNKQKRQTTFLEAVETVSNTRVFYGHFLRKRQICFRCGASWNVHEEKMTDVSIAVEMLNDASDDLTDTALLISADILVLNAPVLEQHWKRVVAQPGQPPAAGLRLRFSLQPAKGDWPGGA